MKVTEFKKAVWDYYQKEGRHTLPWRKTRDPYRILVSEIMLQQTQALRVVPKYREFIKKFPTLKKLREADTRELLKAWSGLGYNRRALYLKRTAEVIQEKYGGKFPKDFETLITLPGIGKYTASAILAFAYNKPVSFIETNIRSVFIYHFFKNKKSVSDSAIFPYIEKTLEEKNPREWYWALMDYGSYLKKLNGNPSRASAHHFTQSKFKGSLREARGAILKRFLTSTHLRKKDLEKLGFESTRLTLAIDGLLKDGLLQKRGDFYMLV